jgi:GAF domain-containing protein
MSNKIEKYKRLIKQAEELLLKESTLIAQMATINALLYHKTQNIFWVGFYFRNQNSLIVGPYQGPLACLNLPHPNGVCWTSILKKEPIIVPDVSAFPGHIACDSRSKSEMVIPVLDSSGEPFAVIDIDSDKLNRFDNEDLWGINEILNLITIDYINSYNTIFINQ